METIEILLKYTALLYLVLTTRNLTFLLNKSTQLFRNKSANAFCTQQMNFLHFINFIK